MHKTSYGYLFAETVHTILRSAHARHDWTMTQIHRVAIYLATWPLYGRDSRCAFHYYHSSLRLCFDDVSNARQPGCAQILKMNCISKWIDSTNDDVTYWDVVKTMIPNYRDNNGGHKGKSYPRIQHTFGFGLEESWQNSSAPQRAWRWTKWDWKISRYFNSPILLSS